MSRVPSLGALMLPPLAMAAAYALSDCSVSTLASCLWRSAMLRPSRILMMLVKLALFLAIVIAMRVHRAMRPGRR
jgi:hypothetical protein